MGRNLAAMTTRILAAALLLSSCSAERRLQRLVERHPELQRTDTVTVDIRIPIPADTIREVVTLHDTVTVENERQVVRIVRVPTGSPCDTVPALLDVDAVVKPDTIWATREVYVDRIVPCPPGKRVAAWWRTVALVLGGILALLVWMRRHIGG